MNKDTLEGKRVLNLVLKRKWFDLIKSGEKKEEYRDLSDHWGARLCYKIPLGTGGYLTKWMQLREGNFDCLNDTSFPNFQDWDEVCFIHGYKPDAERITLQFKGIEIKEGKPEWGAEPGQQYFVIKLGDIIDKH